MANPEKKILKALVEIEETMEKLDGTLDQMEDTDSRVKHFIEQEKAIHEIKKIVRAADKMEKYEEKDLSKWAHRIKVDVDGQEKALLKIAKETDKLDETLSKMSDDDGKVKSFVAQKKVIHQVKKILHNCGLYDKYVEDELDQLV